MRYNEFPARVRERGEYTDQDEAVGHGRVPPSGTPAQS